MEYPINYDFGTNWQTKIVPFLEHPKVLRAITRGVNGYLNNFPLCKKKYKQNTPPARYSSKDLHVMLMDRKEEIQMKKLRKEKKLPKDFLAFERKSKKNTDDDDESWIRIMEWQNEILEPYTCWDAEVVIFTMIHSG